MVSAVFDVRDTLGALLIGVVIACCLFGIISIQAFTYYTRFPKDKLHLKVIVLVLLLCEAGHAISLCQGTYFLIVSAYGDPLELLRLPRVLAAGVSFNGVIGPLVQIFFAERVRVVSGQIYIPLLCCALSIVRGCLTFVTMERSLRIVFLPEVEQAVKVVIPILLGVGAAVDVILAATLSFYVGRRKKSSSTLLVNSTLLWTIQTGLASFICGIAMLITFLKMPRNFVWLGIFAVLGRTFTCALLASLNGRTSVQRHGDVLALRHTGHREAMQEGYSNGLEFVSSSKDKVQSNKSDGLPTGEHDRKASHSIE